MSVTSTPPPTERRRLRGDDGETLVEILATVTVMGIAVVSVLFALGAGIAFSNTHRSQANAGVAVTAAAEAVKGATPVACPINNRTYGGALSGATLPSGWTSSNLAITSTACDGLGLQTITITATAPDGRASTTVQVIKRSPS